MNFTTIVNVRLSRITNVWQPNADIFKDGVDVMNATWIAIANSGNAVQAVLVLQEHLHPLSLQNFKNFNWRIDPISKEFMKKNMPKKDSPCTLIFDEDSQLFVPMVIAI